MTIEEVAGEVFPSLGLFPAVTVIFYMEMLVR